MKPSTMFCVFFLKKSSLFQIRNIIQKFKKTNKIFIFLKFEHIQKSKKSQTFLHNKLSKKIKNFVKILLRKIFFVGNQTGGK